MTRTFLTAKARLQAALAGRERGASTIEYFGVIVVAVILIVALIGAFTTFDLGGKVSTELAKIQSGS
ncbi:hypothetical protein ET495_09800 [Xylanimonas allomyrinae]|uniref:Uncharacterized protein n=1 Tax=Xylanimonas allomyrinae TaxID=2509459 RepID=A0A4P6EZJ9_9MICO|nr:hypothetical protein [Xylanimonas allomyrinae]QAY63498.1 hypothetical protein ET495_09800 [Xylanimonas allomyrinae]